METFPDLQVLDMTNLAIPNLPSSHASLSKRESIMAKMQELQQKIDILDTRASEAEDARPQAFMARRASDASGTHPAALRRHLRARMFLMLLPCASQTR